MAEQQAPVLELRGITKRFPGVLANDRVDFDLHRGEVHALLGENGAGKSTLMNVLYGLYSPDEGEILINGKPANIGSPREAIDHGIGMVHQHFMLIPVMTVAENVVLAAEPRKAGVFLDYDQAVQKVRELAASFNFAIDPDARIENITVGQQQRVEILKALYRGADILILDEPTAVLTPQEADELFGILQTLQREGMSIIFISHKLREVLEIADRVTVLRRGKKIETVPREGATQDGLARLMVGRDVLLRVDKAPAKPRCTAPPGRGPLRPRRPRARGRPRCLVRGPLRRDRRYRGGRRERPERADRRAHRPPEGARRPRVRRRQGRDDRERSRPLRRRSRPHPGGSSSPRPRARLHARREPRAARLRESSRSRSSAGCGRGGWSRPRASSCRSSTCGAAGHGPARAALSGGNQQKVVVAREVSRDPRVLIAAQPTRGLDVGAIEFVHRRLVDERDEGRAVLLISLELDEILSLSDRILVIYEGQIVAEYGPDVTEAELGIAMTGGRVGEAAAS